MENAPARYRHTPVSSCPRIALLLLLMAVMAVSSYAQGIGRVTYIRDEEPKEIRPYVIGYAGYGNPVDVAYDEVFNDPFFRLGGGFGMKFHDFGAELVLRRGAMEQSKFFAVDGDEDVFRNFYLSTTELQLRLYGALEVKRFKFPGGIGIGLVNMTVDRGYPGIFDRFSGTGIFVSPFAAVEYKVNDYFSFGVEAEYALSEAQFNGSEAWQNQHGDRLSDRGGELNTAVPSFWDTVGGENDSDFEHGGLIVSVRAVVYIPTYQGEK